MRSTAEVSRGARACAPASCVVTGIQVRILNRALHEACQQNFSKNCLEGRRPSSRLSDVHPYFPPAGKPAKRNPPAKRSFG